mgnify:CR=1 FL=1
MPLHEGSARGTVSHPLSHLEKEELPSCLLDVASANPEERRFFAVKLRVFTHLSLLVALSVILSRLFGIMIPIAGVGAVRFSFGDLPVLLAGIVFGPLPGLLVGVLSDLIGYVVNTGGGPYFPLFTLSSALTGLLPALMVRRQDREEFPTFWRLALAVTVTGLICSVGLNTLFLHLLYKKGILVLLPARLVSRLILIPLQTVLLSQLGRQYQAFLQKQAFDLRPKKS